MCAEAQEEVRPLPVACPAAAGPVKPFLHFMHSQPRHITPTAALAAYKAYEQEERQRSAAKFCEIHGEDGILTDLHQGTHLLRAFDWRLIRTRRLAATFLNDLACGAFAGISLTTDCRGAAWVVLGGADLGSAAMQAPVHTPPHFLSDAGRCTMVFPSVEAELSVWDFHEVLQRMPGFIDAWLEPEAIGSLLRTGGARFESPEHLDVAVRQLTGTAVRGRALRPQKAVPQEHCRVLLAPPAASRPAQLAADTEAAAELIAALDAAAGLPASGTQRLLAAGGEEPGARLDLRVLYLRRVHHFCLYSAAWCLDERELLQRCGTACLRAQGEAWAGDRAWATEHGQRLRRFLGEGSAWMRPEPVPASADEEPLRSLWAKRCAECTLQEEESRYRCLICSKLFKGEDYMQKHMLRAHAGGLRELTVEFRGSQARAAYLRASATPSQH